MTGWPALATQLADELVARGKLWSPEWIAAVRATPRHELVPTYLVQDPATRQWITKNSAADGLCFVYSNAGLYTKIGAGGPWLGGPQPLSSSSTPSLMTRMLEALDVRDGDRVLEIGTGTGYNAALLCHRLGDDRVFSVDIDEELVDLARERLARIGYRPTLAAVEGADGLGEHAPYDRIIATCSVPSVPWPWIEQLTDGGLLIADVKRTIIAGNLVALRRIDGRATGMFDPDWAGFMAMHHGGDQQTAPPQRDRATAAPRPSRIDLLRPWEQTPLWFLACLRTSRDLGFGVTRCVAGAPADTFIYATDGSWAEVSGRPEASGAHLVWEHGPQRLWQAVENAHATWHDVGCPGWGRFGLTVRPDSQRLWLDDADSEHSWVLPRD